MVFINFSINLKIIWVSAEQGIEFNLKYSDKGHKDDSGIVMG